MTRHIMVVSYCLQSKPRCSKWCDTEKMCSSRDRRVCCLQRVTLSPWNNRRLATGTGKSVLLREIIKTLGGGPSPTLGITASTGIASVNIGGTTIHSWAGIGLGQEPGKTLAGKILGQPKLQKVRDRWQAVQSLIIDEGMHFPIQFVFSWPTRLV